MADLAERFKLAESTPSGEYVWDLDYLTDGDVVEIRHVSKQYGLPYKCVNRDQGRRYFELLRPEFDESTDSRKLVISQGDEDNNFARFEVVMASKSNFKKWHHRDGYDLKNVVIPN